MATDVNLQFLIIFISIYNQHVYSELKVCKSFSGVNYTYVTNSNQSYFITPEPMTWEEALIYCKKHTADTGRLVEFHDLDSTEVAKAQIKLLEANEPLWLGGQSKVQDKFMYMDGKLEVNYNAINANCLGLNFTQPWNWKINYSATECNNENEALYICRRTDQAAFSNGSIFISNKTTGWYRARNRCYRHFKEGHGDLFYLQKNEELGMLRNILSHQRVKTNRLYYIGVHKRPWFWNESGDSVVLANWTTLQPDETTVACLITDSNGSIDDKPCSQQYRGFCVGPRNSTYKQVCENSKQMTKLTSEINLPMWIGVGVGAGLCLLFICISVFLCCRRKSLPCCQETAGKPKSASDQFYYLNNTVDAPKPSYYSTEPSKQNNTIKSMNEVNSGYETLGHLTPEGSTSIGITPDVTMRQTPANQNGVLRKDIYSQVLRKKNNQNSTNERTPNGVQSSDVTNDLNEPDIDNDDHDIIDNDIYNFYNS